MNRVLTNVEFFTFENEVWFRAGTGDVSKLKECDHDLINAMMELISSFYPKAYTALCSEYKNCALNLSYYRFRIVSRFIRCNFGAIDNIPDITSDLHCNFEHIACPLRGECRYEDVICCPKFDHKLSPSEMRVMALIYDGCNEDEIGDRLKLSPLTVHTHVRNAYARLGIHSRGEFIKYAAQNKIFS